MMQVFLSPSFKFLYPTPSFHIFSPAFIGEMRDEVENMPGDFTPSKIVHDEKRLDRVLKENRALVMRCKELEIKLESRYNLMKTC